VCAGYTQLKLLDVNNVGRLLHKCMPSSWLSATSSTPAPVVEWNPSSFGHPPDGWLESVWLFLVNHAPRDLAFVEGLPLVPCRTVDRAGAPRGSPAPVTELVPLSTRQTCVARQLDGLSLSTDVEQVTLFSLPFVCYKKSSPSQKK